MQMQAKNKGNARVQSQPSVGLATDGTDERTLRIAEGAYFRAAQRGFVGGDPVQDWLDAEQEVDGPPCK